MKAWSPWDLHMEFLSSQEQTGEETPAWAACCGQKSCCKRQEELSDQACSQQVAVRDTSNDPVRVQ